MEFLLQCKNSFLLPKEKPSLANIALKFSIVLSPYPQHLLLYSILLQLLGNILHYLHKLRIIHGRPLHLDNISQFINTTPKNFSSLLSGLANSSFQQCLNCLSVHFNFSIKEIILRRLKFKINSFTLRKCFLFLTFLFLVIFLRINTKGQFLTAKT